MVSRLQNKNNGYSENLFSHNPRIDNNTLNSIDGATALKLDESFEIKDETQSNLINDTSINLNNEDMIQCSITNNNVSDTSPSISIESASYFENNNMANEINHQEIESVDNEEEHSKTIFRGT